MSTQYFILNTNIQAGEEDEQDMLTHHKAAAYFAPFKYKIEKIKKGDIVFLYRSKVGILAKGMATGVLQKSSYRNRPEYPEDTYSMPLDKFQLLPHPISASDIKKTAGKNMVFIQTLIKIDAQMGEKLWKFRQPGKSV